MSMNPSTTTPSLDNSQTDTIEAIVQSMSLREKIGQTVQMGLKPELFKRASLKDYFEEFPVGSVFCGGEIIKKAEGRSTTLRGELQLCQKANRLPLMVAGDLENGAGAAIADQSKFPTLLSLGTTDDEAIAYEYGKYTALEGSYVGFNWTFSPVVDLLKNWLNPIVSNRGMGDDPKRVAAMANALIQGLQENGLAACAKHFPGDGVDFRDQHLITSTNSLTEAEWWQQHGYVFQSVIDKGVRTIMAGHIAMPWCDPVRARTGRPRPATVSQPILTELLRDRMGFEGVLVSDALIMAGYVGWAKRDQRLLEAFVAGNDVMLWPGEGYFGLMERALDEGTVTMERLDTSVRRVLKLKQAQGILDTTKNTPEPSAEALTQLRSEAINLSRTVAEKSITLVRNRQDLLPIDTKKVRTVLLHAAIPEHADDSHIAEFARRLEARGLEVTQIKNGNCLQVYLLEQEGKTWDAYIVVYSLQNHQMKNAVRPVGELGEVQWTQQFVETMEPITISLNTPYLLFDNPYLDTLVNAYGTSMESIDALDRALFGEIPFTDKSPVSLDAIPERTGYIG